jgi:competence protein ComEC
VALLWPFLEWVAALPGTQWVQAAPAPWTWAPAALGTLLLLAPRGVPGRWLGCLYLAPMLVWTPPAPPPGGLWFTLLDVGQGLAAVVRTHDHVLVYDTGPRFGPDFDTGAAVLVPYLRSQGIRRVDRLIVSHGDNDHIGGTASLLERFPAAAILSSVPARLPPGAQLCRRGRHWRWDGVEFRILHPGRKGAAHGNDASCVLRVTSAAGAVLLTGDIEAPAERILLTDVPGALRARVLVVPHHGSRSSSTPAFLAAVHPELALLPVGYRNRFRFPNPGVTARYRAAGVRMLDTAAEGAVTVRMAPGARDLHVSTQRRSVRRYWHWRAPPVRARE